MEQVELCWLEDFSSREEALKKVFLLSGQQIKKHAPSKSWAQKKVLRQQVDQIPINLVNYLKINPLCSIKGVEIICENDDFICVHKPPFCHSYPQCYTDTDTVLNALLNQRRYDMDRVEDTNHDRGLLYRLDYETSGLLVFAKKSVTVKEWRSKFFETVKSKNYLAITPKGLQRGEFIHYLKASGPDGSKQKVFEQFVEGSVEAKLKFESLYQGDDFQLLKIQLITGHRHQIRAQLSHLGLPLLGDELYGGKKAERLYLHAWEYQWEWKEKKYSQKDDTVELFENFLDLNRLL